MPRRGLDRDAVVAAAEQLVDAQGSKNLSMTALARKLGVQVPSLYNHVESIEALLGYVQNRALTDLGLDLQRAAMGKSGRHGVEGLARALRDFASRRPGRYELAMSAPIDRPAMQAAGATAGAALAAVVESFGVEVTPELAFVTVSTLHGALALDRSGLFRGSVELADVYDDAVELVVTLIKRAAKAGHGRAAPAQTRPG